MKRYFVWKDPDCNGISPEWLEISGNEFYDLVNDPANSERTFIPWCDEDEDGKDSFIFEVTEEEFKEWDRNRKREAYRRKAFFDEKILFVDWDEVVYYDDTDPVTLGDVIPDPDAHVEPTAEEELIEDLYEALKTLSKKERQIIDALYLKNDDNKSEREITRELGISHMTMNCRKNRVLKKLRKYFAQKK